MRAFAVASCIAAVAYASPSAETLFDEFMQNFDRKYTSEEKGRRFKIFKENMAIIDASNAQNKSYTLGMTPHTDLTFEEFQAQFVGGFIPMKFDGNVTQFEKSPGFANPESVDWVEAGAVSSVKSQGTCGSCWSFSTAGALEGAMKVAGHELPVEGLSNQMLLDCDNSYGHGCAGGIVEMAFGWVEGRGICSFTDYPYKCVDVKAAACTAKKCDKTCTPVLAGGSLFKKGDVTGFSKVGQTEGDLEAAVAQQPISVAVQANSTLFQHYKSGVLTGDGCGNKLDHSVLVVGYGTDAGTKYWKVKNSYSATWGESGYLRILRGKADGYGECGIRETAIFPTVRPKTDDVVV